MTKAEDGAMNWRCVGRKILVTLTPFAGQRTTRAVGRTSLDAFIKDEAGGRYAVVSIARLRAAWKVNIHVSDGIWVGPEEIVDSINDQQPHLAAAIERVAEKMTWSQSSSFTATIIAQAGAMTMAISKLIVRDHSGKPVTSGDTPPCPTEAIHRGDCVETMRRLAESHGPFADLIFADPPYNIGYEYDQYKDKLDGDKYVEWMEGWINACAIILKPSGSFYVLIGDEYAAEARMCIKRLEKSGGLHLRNWIIWHYTFGQNCQNKFNRSHVHLLYCVGSGVYAEGSRRPTPKFSASNPPFTFNKAAIAVPSARQTTYGDKRAVATGKNPDDVWYLRPQEAVGDNGEMFNTDQDTWYIPRVCGTFTERVEWHPCQLPEAMLERVIKVSSNRNDIVFDPFSGSGTTLAVARRLGRRWMGCELSEEYAKRAMDRIMAAHPA